MKKNCEIIFKDIETKEEYIKTIEKVVNECYQVEGLENTNIYVSITLTTPKEIRSINKEYRNIDMETDVLSFPMFEKDEIKQFVDNKELNQEVLGDIVISIPKVYEQAEEYGHSFERELSYLVVHGFYHLLGYDHMIEEEKSIMRQKEEKVLEHLNISRDEKKNPEIEGQDKNKTTKNKGFLDAWKNAINGIIYATTTQGNVKKQLVVAVLVIIISLFFDLSKAEFLCFMFTIILVIFAEMVNTAIETVVDLYIDIYHPKAKIAKDVAAGGVVVTAINAIIVGYFLFFEKISDIGLQFIKNVANSPIHLAFAAIIITIIGILTLIAIATTNKNKILNKMFLPSGHAALAFAANTIIWLTTDNIVIITLSLVSALLVGTSRIEAKVHKLSEIVFSSCVGIIIVLIVYGLAMATLSII